MKTLIIIILIILCLIIIKKKIEPFLVTSYEDIMHMIETDEDIKRTYLNNYAEADKVILKKYRELNDLKIYIQNNNFNELKSNVEQIKKKYYDTKIKLERLIFNKYKTNSINFYEYNNEFRQKLISFINDINTNEVTDYGSTVDAKICDTNWRFPINDNTNEIKSIDDNDNLIDTDNCCKLTTPEECKKEYKTKLIELNQQKLVLQNEDQVLKLNKYKYDLYIININNKYLKYEYNIDNNSKPEPVGKDYIEEQKNLYNLLFRVVKINDLNHLNIFLTYRIEYSDIEFPLYLIYKEEANRFITFELNNLSIQPLNKDIIKQQIFYKKSF